MEVIVPTYRNYGLLAQLIRAVSRQTLHPIRLHIVDDGSPGGASAPKNTDIPLNYSYRFENRGFASACNFGLRNLQCDAFVLLNSDVRFSCERWLCRLASSLKHSDFAAPQGARLTPRFLFDSYVWDPNED